MDDYRTTHIGRLLLELSHDFVAEANDRIRRKGFEFVRSAHIAVMAQIDEGGTELGRVVERVGTSKQAVNKVIRQLESLDVVTLEACARDSRARVVCFTPAGRKFLRAALDAVRATEAMYESELGPAAFASLKKHLLRLAEKRNVFARSYKEENEG
jgi:DNA-binding MarR family transcriptional regulator